MAGLNGAGPGGGRGEHVRVAGSVSTSALSCVGGCKRARDRYEVTVMLLTAFCVWAPPLQAH